ncbi:hypothetical protein ACFP65_07680 [Marinilactibacillus sp. GCM10026970]|uniref:hypothetical protein n=1 Tax=Marinilactibacillus sp. GCM10026970 TaxID=3252642 RepID=UPI00360E5A5D
MTKNQYPLVMIRLVLYISIVFLIGASLVINNWYNAPTSEILMNYLLPTMLIVFGIEIEEYRKASRLIMIFLGLLFFIYIAVHYLIGFHNPYWGN